MQLTTQDAIRVMHKLEVEMVECKHHVRGFVVLDGRRLFAVHCSHGRKDLPGDVPHRFRRCLKLSVDEFEELRRCTLSRDGYFDLLHSKGVLQR